MDEAHVAARIINCAVKEEASGQRLPREIELPGVARAECHRSSGGCDTLPARYARSGVSASNRQRRRRRRRHRRLLWPHPPVGRNFPRAPRVGGNGKGAIFSHLHSEEFNWIVRTERRGRHVGERRPIVAQSDAEQTARLLRSGRPVAAAPECRSRAEILRKHPPRPSVVSRNPAVSRCAFTPPRPSRPVRVPHAKQRQSDYSNMPLLSFKSRRSSNVGADTLECY